MTVRERYHPLRAAAETAVAAERERIMREVVGPLVEALERLEKGLSDLQSVTDEPEWVLAVADIEAARKLIPAALAAARQAMEKR